MQPRILFVTHTAVLGGAELSLVDLATTFQQTSQVLTFADGPLVTTLEDKGVDVTVLPASPALLGIKTSSHLSTLGVIPDVIKLAYQLMKKARQGFDVIHINSQKALVVVILAAALGPLPPVVWHLRDILTANHFSRFNRRLAVFLANRYAAKIIVNSQATADGFLQTGGRADLVEVIYNGIADTPFNHLPLSSNAPIRQRLGIYQAPLIGVFSRLSYWKGQHLILHALTQLPDFHVIIVGDALFGETDYVEHLHRLTASLGLCDRVHWLGFRRDIPELMAACDYIVHPSTEPEPFGRVLVEGLLARRPVIAAAAGGALEILQDGITGRLFPPNSVEALCQVIQSLQNNPQQRQQLAEQGDHYARRKFSLEASLTCFSKAMAALSSQGKKNQFPATSP